MAVICDICKQRPAATRINFAVNGQPKVLDVCAEDFARFQQGAEEMLMSLQQDQLTALPAESYTKVLVKKSADVAAEYGQHQIASEHMLSALVSDTAAKNILQHLNINPADLEGYISVNALKDSRYTGTVELSADAQGIITQAHEAAHELGVDQPGPVHLLLAMSSDNGMAGTLLRKFGVTPDHIKKVMEEQSPEELFGAMDTPTLNEYSRDLTQLAKEKQLDPLIGRQAELDSVIEILSRRRKNNPVLVGDPGVGKSAIVEGLAQRIESKAVPKHLLGKRVVELSLNNVLAGSKYRGEFEERLQKVIDEIVENSDRLIVFIDEIHTVVGTGANEGSMDAANILKPALARGSLHLIGATTRNEYQKYIEKDSALERRFQPVSVKEPTLKEAEAIISGVKSHYEKHHSVTIEPSAIKAAVSLSDRYITHRYLPDKALDLIDQAGAKARIAAIDSTKGKPKIDGGSIALVLAQLTGIPVTQLNDVDREKMVTLEQRLHKRIIGQNPAVSAVAHAVRMSYAGLTERNKPIATLFFMGPTGVGKTELAKALAAEVFGTENALIRVDMSEFMERHSVARLIGSPPGYVGYEEGGQLTEAVRRAPYSVILLDEIEKAHAEVANVLLQVFDDGRLTDGKGRVVDFSNTIIIATSNIAGVKGKSTIGFQESPSELSTTEYGLEQLKQHFRPEFINRIDEVILFHALDAKQISEIVHLELQKVKARLKAQKVSLQFNAGVVSYISKIGFNDAYGARELRRVIKQHVEQPLAKAVLAGEVKPGSNVSLTIHNGEVMIHV